MLKADMVVKKIFGFSHNKKKKFFQENQERKTKVRKNKSKRKGKYFF